MPRNIMHNDAAHATVATAGGFLAYGLTLSEWVAILWGAYVLILIVTKLPDLLAAVERIQQAVGGWWARVRGGGK